MRIDKLLSNLKYGSRKEIKQLMKNKGVTVNGDIVKDASCHVDPDQDVIFVHGERVVYKEFVYYMMNKPSGYISATKDGMHKTVINLLKPEDQVYDVFPCGRLDLDTEGLMILSNDGNFAHQLTHPKKDVYKTYVAIVDGRLTQDDIDQFYNGLEIKDGQNEPYQTKRAYLTILHSGEESEAEVSIKEGKFHQVKRMFLACGKEVTYLKRIKIGKLTLDDTLNLGEYRELTEDERQLLFENELAHTIKEDKRDD